MNNWQWFQCFQCSIIHLFKLFRYFQRLIIKLENFKMFNLQEKLSHYKLLISKIKFAKVRGSISWINSIHYRRIKIEPMKVIPIGKQLRLWHFTMYCLDSWFIILYLQCRRIRRVRWWSALMRARISSSDSADWRLDIRVFGVPLIEPELCLDGCVGNDERRIRGGGLAPTIRFSAIYVTRYVYVDWWSWSNYRAT